ncbi:Sulfite reductase [NADPH] flavoprotein alpha-component [Alcanivorax sp. ALC70]|nr:Sulfite reductase [NADPH] flavoprotein alpha-component [Alcanivorax sp. ALC70]
MDVLRPLQPRLYDLANSLEAENDALHLTVKRFRYEFEDRWESGIASHYLLNLQPEIAFVFTLTTIAAFTSRTIQGRR